MKCIHIGIVRSGLKIDVSAPYSGCDLGMDEFDEEKAAVSDAVVEKNNGYKPKINAKTGAEEWDFI